MSLQSWECHRCGKVYAPTTPQCLNLTCGAKETLVPEKFTDPKWTSEHIFDAKQYVGNIQTECKHEWDCTQIYASNPPKARCLKCGDYKVIGGYVTGSTFT